MPRAPDERVGRAKELFLKGTKLVDIAKQLELPEGTVRRWKSTYRWDSERSDKNSERSDRKKGGQPKNKNATGPPKNKHAETHGLFSKYLPKETLDIAMEIESMNPLDIIWANIQIAYASILRAQSIMFVENKEEMIKEVKRVKTRKEKSKLKESNENEVEYEFQFAWDRQATFLKSQAKVQAELRSLIKQYDEMLHKNWDSVTEEQKARIEAIKFKIDKSNGMDNDKINESLISIVDLIRNPKPNRELPKDDES